MSRSVSSHKGSRPIYSSLAHSPNISQYKDLSNAPARATQNRRKCSHLTKRPVNYVAGLYFVKVGGVDILDDETFGGVDIQNLEKETDVVL